jgi:putative methionine-R-sulfoxide reductase with GAF domain
MAKNNGTQAAEMTTQARNALRVATITLGFAVAADILCFALAFWTGAWQLFAWGIDIFGSVVVLLASIWLIRRGRSVLAVWLMFGGLAVVVSLAMLWIAGLGLASGLGCVIALSQMTVQMLPPKQTGWGFIASVVVGAAVLLVDVYGPANRLTAPSEMMTFVLVIVALMALVLVFLLARQFVNYTLHMKLLTAFLAVALIPMSLLAFLNNRATRMTLNDDANQALFAAASQTAANIDAFINANLDVIRTEAQLPLWSKYLKLVADQKSDGGIEAEVRATLRALRRKAGISSYALLDHQGRDVMDTFASHIGTDKSDREYFQEPLKSGLPYVSPVEFSPTTGKASLYFSSPVRSSAGHVVGVLRMRYDATVLQALVVQNNGLAGPDSFAVLFDEYHIRLAHGTAPEMILQAVAPLDPARVAELQAAHRLPDLPVEELSTDLPALKQNLANAADQPYFAVEDAAVSGRTNQAAVTTLRTQPWLVSFFQPQDVFLAPVEAQERSAALVVVVMTLVVVAAALGVAQLLAGPIIRLTAVAASVTAGDLTAQARVESSDEIGTLATTFNSMTKQLRELISGLEQRVAERTRGLQAAAEVSRATTSVLDPNELLRQTVDLVRERFDLYYVGLFLLDEERRFAVLHAGTGEAGQKMLARGHRLKVGGISMVGWCTANAQARIALDVGEEAVRFDNPLLPDTHSEMALPLISRGQVIGALDVQSTKEAAFDEADIAVMQTMADQLANAIENARLFEETQRLAQRERIISQITSKLRSALNLETILQAAVQDLGQALGASEAIVRLGTETTLLSPEMEAEPGEGDVEV